MEKLTPYLITLNTFWKNNMAYLIKRKVASNKFINLFLIKNFMHGFLNKEDFMLFNGVKGNILRFKNKIKNKVKSFIEQYFIIKEKYFFYGRTLEIEKFLEEVFMSAMIFEFSLEKEAMAMFKLMSLVKKKIMPKYGNNNPDGQIIDEIKKELADVYNIKIFCNYDLLRDFEEFLKKSLIIVIVHKEDSTKIVINSKKNQQELFVTPLVIEKIFKRAYKRSRNLIRENLYVYEC